MYLVKVLAVVCVFAYARVKNALRETQSHEQNKVCLVFLYVWFSENSFMKPAKQHRRPISTTGLLGRKYSAAVYSNRRVVDELADWLDTSRV